MITTLTMASLLFASAPTLDPILQDDPATSSPLSETGADNLSARQLAKGRTQRAIIALEKRLETAPDDPALLINLGIAHAQSGDAPKARILFERAIASPDSIQLETADGDAIDSRRLARKALWMLDRGDFEPKLSRRN
ncbi:MAG: tetratricopeptide repeat protein [Pseudomonadota bacterium]